MYELFAAEAQPAASASATTVVIALVAQARER
jgi:hypothetical protein